MLLEILALEIQIKITLIEMLQFVTYKPGLITDWSVRNRLVTIIVRLQSEIKPGFVTSQLVLF